MLYNPGDILFQKYRIEELTGQGGFAKVYRVTHLDLNVERALKILNRDAPGIGSSEYSNFRQRFKIEAQLGAQLNTPTPHPNLLQVHNFQQRDDLLILEMEYAPGKSLADWIDWVREKKKPIPIDKVIKIGIDVASGLA